MNEPRGTEILRHQSSHDGWVAPQGPQEDFVEAIGRHIEQYFGPVEFVYHEVASHLVRMHVMVVEPTEQRPHRTLITSGMSDLPMTVPEGQDISPYAELMISLPADYPLTRSAGMDDDPAGWPLHVLKQVAMLPHEYSTWIGEFHTVPNGDPCQPYEAETPFAGVVVAPMRRVPPEARTIVVRDGVEIALLALIPLHPDEMAVKLERGTDALIELLDRGRVSELLKPDRPSYA
ncbi:hypothetical protein Ais01nite_03620 [Asanoa ishikariensis]|uniref:Suppressor of fused protein (SUFU) n=1 Tax=Asanoa ishikariensis TaxID=137265 RepID=A0A1H3TLN7_9ACTN|nr:suppressor of fused domain protein [Asanoa ishikariensis]GIF62327.1 hypothetical protein Ais01nite_03620 [Asanoa ishikariensis]SDZ50259.1 Suppressor of fused protein (SUFU) [Asanoa ishikariensis]